MKKMKYNLELGLANLAIAEYGGKITQTAISLTPIVNVDIITISINNLKALRFNTSHANEGCSNLHGIRIYS
jgi:hypothetical protein